MSHQSDDLQNYGVWKPKDKANFNAHESNNKTWFIGNGCSNVLFSGTNPDSIFQNIKNVLRAIANGQMPADKFYSMTIMTNQRDFSSAYLQKISWLMDSIQPYVNQGRVVWATLREKLSYFQEWSTRQNQAYSQFACAETPLVTSASNAVQELEALKVFPNPSSGWLQVQGVQGYHLQVFDLAGRPVLQQMINADQEEVNLSGLSPGMYVVKAQRGAAWRVTRVVRY